ncbi:tRNA-uridine aminocarboxypropyltransferase 2-like [Eriocheir sinensis]|uniref:tRNA-uridine aminocarboxypropyltransferase 2-like n=1 Tax=Eriocheir sinensis TaxID=95602 RepID=UPI0021C95CF7|nr:tRNA-uridine aminocarboxypropyltransferase 2-like [Eriocheir sinensis]
MEEVEEELSLLSNLVNIEIGRREKRPICDNCSRPAGVCWCRGLGGHRVKVQSRVIVLQHPHEEKRCLRTAPILKAALPPRCYVELRGKRFSLARHPELSQILTSGHTILMYPGDGARGVEELPRVGDREEEEEEEEEAGGGGGGGGGGKIQPPYNIVILDGTWQQAKSIYHNCSCLHSLPQVCLSGRYTSEYIIRTQPTDDALSTVETAALALAILENDWTIYDTLVQPLRMLCRYQLSHGAVPHQSKEHMLVSGRCRRPLGKRTYKKLRKCGARYPHALAALLTSGGGEVEEVEKEAEEEKERKEEEEEEEREEEEKEETNYKNHENKTEEEEDDERGGGEEENKGGGGGGGGGGKSEEEKCVTKAKRNISGHIPWELR